MAASGGLIEAFGPSDAREAALDVLEVEDDEYDALELVEVRTEFVGPGVGDGTEAAVVVQRPADAPYPNSVSDLEAALEERTDRDVTVVIEFVNSGTRRVTERAGRDVP